MDAVIEVEDLTRDYGTTRAVDHVSFEVSEGEIFGFLGPNGAGKTTTQRMLTGALRPTSGRVTVLADDMVRQPLAAQRRFGVVPEMANPYAELSGWQNMLLAGELYRVPRQERVAAAEELLREFGLWERRDDRAKGYSKGMKQRLMLGMALIHQPRILFLDEPTSGLDVASSRQIRDRVRDFAASGGTVFYTTHNIDEADMLCDRVAIIHLGKIVAIDSPVALRSTMQHSRSLAVAFEGEVEPARLAELPGVDRAEKEGDRFRLFSADPGQVACEVTDFAREQGLSILSVETAGPRLEEVFLRLTTESHEDAREADSP